MKILALTPQLPYPPRQGTAIRNWGLLKSLSANHQIDLLTFALSSETVAPEIKDVCRRVQTVPLPARSKVSRILALATSRLPDLAHRLHSRTLMDLVGSRLSQERYQALLVEGLEMAGPIVAELGVRTIFDAHNCETILQRRAFESDRRQPARWLSAAYSQIQYRRLSRYEASIVRRASHVTCVSHEDAAALADLAPGLKSVVVPNGIFLDDYNARRFAGPGDADPALVFTGKMDYRPNVDAVLWFADSIFPEIRRSLPRARFVIVGQQPVSAVLRLAERPGITVTGAVPDARPFIAAATVYVAPLRMGGGTRFKLLEAMALGRPIVSTRIGAEGFGVVDGREVILTDNETDFAAAVAGVATNQPRSTTMGIAGRAFAATYDWSRIVPALEALLAGHP